MHDIRPLTAEDLEAVIALDKAATGTSRRGYFEKRLAAATSRPGDYVYSGLEEGGALVGFAFAKLVSGEFGKPGASAALDAIGVDPAHGRKGYGQALLGDVARVLAGKGVATLSSQIEWGSPMAGFLARVGFALAPRLVLTRTTEPMAQELEGEREDQWDAEPDYSSPEGDAADALSRDRVLVRSMRESDLGKIIAIDRENTGTDRSDYLTRKMHDTLHESGVRVSLVAEMEGYPVGFIMARVDFGEFGHTGTEAEMDTLGVDPAYRGKGVGRALMAQLIANLATLRVETIRTEIDWNDTGLITFLGAVGFAPAQRLVLVRGLKG